MAIITATVGLLGRFVGKILTAALGWASILLFGRVPQNKQIILVLITFGSVAWVALVAGVVFPAVGTFLLGAALIPSFVDRSWIRLAMLVAAIALPPVLGLATVFIRPKRDRAQGAELVRSALRGYPLAAVLAIALIFLGVIGLLRKARATVRRWADAHVAIVVRPGGYDRMVADLEQALDDAGLDVSHGDAPAVLVVPARLLAMIAGPGVKSLVPDRLVQLTGHGLEIQLYPSDIAMAGRPELVTRARAAVASRLTSTAAFLTTTAEAEGVEERLERLANSARDGIDADRVATELASIDDALAHLNVEYDEWETLYRIRLQVERDLLTGQVPGRTFPGDPAGEPFAKTEREPASGLQVALATMSIGLVLLDVVLALRDRRRN